jgi:hypothetical protein
MKKTLAITAALLLALGTTAPAFAIDWQLQDTKVTPGLLNKSVTQADIKTTVCKVGWTKTIRPTVTYTNKLKDEQLKTTYKSFVAIYGASPSAYEEDHLISLQLGGDPSAPANLWPQPYIGANARKKDVLETKLKRMVCDGSLKLADAQHAILNWGVSYAKYVKPADAKVPVEDTDN